MKNDSVIIERFKTPNYRSLIQILPKNKNYTVLKKIQTILKNENKQWSWLFKRLSIAETSWKTYFSGRENMSMYSIECIAHVLRSYIDSPKELVNDELPILRYGTQFELNLDFILNKYGITQGEVARFTSFDSASISMIVRRKAKQIGPSKLHELYDYLKYRGVPLQSSLDLVYFPSWGEEPHHFLTKRKVKGCVFKFNSYSKII